MGSRFSTVRVLALTSSLVLATAVGAIPGAPQVAAAPPDGPDALADFEGGEPAGWFTYVGATTVDTTTQVVGDSNPLARPGQVGDEEILVADFDVSDFGGFGQDVNLAAGGPQDWSSTAGLSFWFNGSGSGLAYQAEISENRSDPNADTSERFDHVFVDDTAGWRLITIPWSDFSRATDFQPGGAPDDGLTLTEVWAWAIVLPPGADIVYFDDVRLDNPIIDDFESGLPSGTDGDGIPVGFYTFQDSESSTALSTTTTPPAPVPGAVAGNNVLQVDLDVTAFAGLIHGFTNAAADTWVPQDWSSSEGIAFWLHGTNSGTEMFVDILDNRNPGSISDDAERWTVELFDDFDGWQYFEIPFTSFERKEIGNSAPNDGFGLTEVHGWAFGTLDTPTPLSLYLDDVALYGLGDTPPISVQFAQAITSIEEGTTGDVGVRLNRPLGDDDPAEVSIDFATERSTAIPGEEFTPTSGTLTFTKGGPRDLAFPVETFDDTKFEGDEQIVIRLTNPLGADRGALFQGSVLIDDNDPFDPDVLDEFTQGAYLWAGDGGADLTSERISEGSPNARPDQDAVEDIGVASVPLAVDIDIQGTTCKRGNGVVPVHLLSTETFDATTVDHTTVTFGGASEAHTSGRGRTPTRHVDDVDGDGRDDLVFHFRSADFTVACDAAPIPFVGETFDGQTITAGGADAALVRDFPLGQDWTDTEALSFWYQGAGGGEEVTVTLKDNRAPDPGPDGWELAWADEFNESAGTPPNPANWAYELGDTTPDGKNGWGNEELQYYTDDPANASTDGSGNLVIELTEADGSQECYYGPCEFESARLITQNRAEFAYGRIESRLQVPTGGDGLWPAFWSLGTDITYNPWPGAGEIDFMEYVSRLPNEIFGTIHGPGYSGGTSFNGIYDFGGPVYDDFHTFTVEWEPNLITWYVDDIQYHQADPSDVDPNPWVFEKPFFLLLNFAIGGNFGGSVDPNNTYPQEYLVDYVRVYQGPDTAERFETAFVDEVAGWQQVTIPLTDFVRSDEQPAGAPDDGLTLTEVWGYGLEFPDGNASGDARLDLVQRVPLPAPTEIVVTSAADSGPGSLREAVAKIADGGTITFDPSLAGATANLSGPIGLNRDVTIDASAAPGFTLDGGVTDRVLVVDAGVTANVSDVTMTNGFGFQLAGCVLNNGTLTLDGVTVSDCVMTTDGGDFWQGGAGIYNGEGSTLTLVDSTVSDNSSGFAGGGVYSFFGTTTTIERSTISGNTAVDVGGGIRSLGNVDVVNSTISGNTASADFHGGAVFVTDGAMSFVNSTVAGNTSTGGTGDVFVGTFTATGATIELTNTIIQSGPGSGSACFTGFFGGGAVVLASNGGNAASDSSCNLTEASDQPAVDALLGPLADNGGPTLTHALGTASPAIDAALAAACPTIDQRGVSRPQGPGCDVGAYEVE